MKVQRLLTLLITVAAVGCGNENTPPLPMPKLPPLTVQQWKSLPVEEKYDESTFERLREADKSIRSDRAWQRFMKVVVVPERIIDIPGIPGQPHIDPESR